MYEYDCGKRRVGPTSGSSDDREISRHQHYCYIGHLHLQLYQKMKPLGGEVVVAAALMTTHYTSSRTYYDWLYFLGPSLYERNRSYNHTWMDHRCLVQLLVDECHRGQYAVWEVRVCLLVFRQK
jgi:hypothetical protein